MKNEDKTTSVVDESHHSKPIHKGEIPAIPAWIERAAWTEGMLTALQRDKSTKWYSLYDKLTSTGNLRAGWSYVRTRSKATGVDRQSLAGFEKNHHEYIEKVQADLKSGDYRPSAAMRKWVPKLGSKQMRPIGISTVRDRVVHTAIKQIIEPIFERQFLDCSFGFRPERGTKDALRKVQSLLDQGHRWIVDADIESFFDSIDHQVLTDALRTQIVDGKVLGLIDALVKQPVLDGKVRATPTKGTPQGSILSPLLANIYLHSMDQTLTKAGLNLVRYADDLVILCRSEAEAIAALVALQTEYTRLKLKAHPEKTRIVSENTDGFEFLGYRFQGGKRQPRDKSMKKWRANIKLRTPRNFGQSISEAIKTVNTVVLGVVDYFQHVSYLSVFRKWDAFIRRRLRAILLRQLGKSYTFGQGRAHNRWNNLWFADQGLISARVTYVALKDAWNSARQSR